MDMHSMFAIPQPRTTNPQSRISRRAPMDQLE
jgi:hypothetical protein